MRNSQAAQDFQDFACRLLIVVLIVGGAYSVLLSLYLILSMIGAIHA